MNNFFQETLIVFFAFILSLLNFDMESIQAKMLVTQNVKNSQWYPNISINNYQYYYNIILEITKTVTSNTFPNSFKSITVTYTISIINGICKRVFSGIRRVKH